MSRVLTHMAVVLMLVVTASGCPRRSDTPKKDPPPPEDVPSTRVPPDGPYVTWWAQPKGRKQVEGAYQKGRRHGPWIWWYRSGSKRKAVTFVRGHLHGQVRGWFANGKLQLQGQYINGRRAGEWKRFHPSGAVAKRCVYRPDGTSSGCTSIYEFEDDVIDSHCPPTPRPRPGL